MPTPEAEPEVAELMQLRDVVSRTSIGPAPGEKSARDSRVKWHTSSAECASLNATPGAAWLHRMHNHEHAPM